MSPFARLLTSAAVIEPTELKAVLLSFVYFPCLMASYFILRPVRDAKEALDILQGIGLNASAAVDCAARFGIVTDCRTRSVFFVNPATA